MASGGFEPANLGTKSQHATPRPPKPMFYTYVILNLITLLDILNITKNFIMFQIIM